MEKFMGVGLKSAVMIALFTIVFIVMAKVIVTKYPIPGVSEVIQTV